MGAELATFDRPADRPLSVVLAARNDELRQSLELTLDALLHFGVRCQLDAEIVIVEWNPPPGARLHQSLKLSKVPERISLRFIEVPPDVHDGLRHSHTIPIFHAIAKNVGIRRARGRYILVIDPGTLLTEASVSFLASNGLRKKVLYRMQQFYCDHPMPICTSADDRLAWCEAQSGAIVPSASSQPKDGINHLWYRINNLLSARWLSRFKRSTRRVGGRLRPLQRNTQIDPHIGLSDSFTLCHRDHWFTARGYAEAPLRSFYLATMFRYIAEAQGLETNILSYPMCCYTLQNKASCESVSIDQQLRYFRQAPWFDTSLLEEMRQTMFHHGKPIHVNGPDWGFASNMFSEAQLLGANS